MSDQRINMTTKEIQRAGVMNRIAEREITQLEAAEKLALSERQTRRLYSQYKEFGEEGLISKKVGGNRKSNPLFKIKVMEIVRENYVDFKPTFAAEKLEERHGLKVNRETLRQWMIEADLWKGRKRKKARIHQSRARRSRVGVLIQIDGSEHDWFEGRGPKCTLIVFIDDATSKIMSLHFVPTETTAGYFSCMKSYIKNHGIPVAFYSDKHSVFLDNQEDSENHKRGETQFQRATKTLGIEQICAHSPQAKGRVERANQTLQDRLIKEMRLMGINDIETANIHAPELIKKHNDKFEKLPAEPEDAHKKNVFEDAELDKILSIQSTRKVSKNLEVRYENKIYKIQNYGKGYQLRRAEVTIHEQPNGSVTILRKNKILEYTVIDKKLHGVKFAESKEINEKVDKILNKKDSLWKCGKLSSFHTVPQGTTATNIAV